MIPRSELSALFYAIRTGIAHGVGLSLFLLALGLAPEGLIFLAGVQGIGFLVAHQLLKMAGRVRTTLKPQVTYAEPVRNASTTLGWASGSATSAKRIS